MVLPPFEELTPLYEAAQIGYIEGIKQEVVPLQKLDYKYTKFTDRILKLADSFEYEDVVKLVDRYFLEKS
ncbi:MAG TPA: hypothetical protein V6C85_29305 [Allocoleopsis sp.]